MERATGRNREPSSDPQSLTWDRSVGERRAFAPSSRRDDDHVDVEGFPVVVRLAEIQSQMAHLTQRVDRIVDLLDRVERAIADGLSATRGVWRGGDKPFPHGITGRANPMTHPLTPLSVRSAATDTGRDEVLSTVRALFQHRRPWWQRLPGLLRG